jgi:glycosyltransferase involved in cell wall biosynthesis
VNRYRREGLAGAPDVSVILPVRDYGRYLSDALASLEAQKFRDWECIAIDDGSVDDTPQLLREFGDRDPRLSWHQQPARGLSASRNLGLQLARGEFVQFLDADDLVHPMKFQTQVDHMRTHPAIDVVFSPSAYFNDGDVPDFRTLASSTGTTNGYQRSTALSSILRANPFTVESPLVRAAVLGRSGGFDEGLPRMEDRDLWLRLAINGARFEFVETAEVMSLVRRHATNMSGRVAPMLLSEITVRRKVHRSLIDPADRSLNNDRLAESRALAGKLIGVEGSPMRGLRLLLPVAIARRRPRWLLWSIGLVILWLPGGRGLRRLVGRARRHPEGPRRMRSEESQRDAAETTP